MRGVITHGEQKHQKRLADVRAFLVFSLLNLALLCGGGAAIVSCGVAVGFNTDPVIDVWLWVFAFPCQAASSLGSEPIAFAFLFVNPFVYGAVWWFLWKMVRLMRAKPAEDESPPLRDG